MYSSPPRIPNLWSFEPASPLPAVWLAVPVRMSVHSLSTARSFALMIA